MSKNLKIEMFKKDVSNFNLAKHLNVDPSKVSKIVNGWIQPDENLKKQIADFLGVSVSTIWGKVKR